VDFGHEQITGILMRAPVVIFSLVIHEYMHAYTAYRCGDDTARRLGRLTLNPLPHLDLLGTICLLMPGSPIGWAKPVPVDPYNYRHPRRDEILVSGAGVAANFAAGVIFSLVLRLLFFAGVLPTASPFIEILATMLIMGIFINFGLMIFNLLPIFPLDGSHILMELLPFRAKERFAEFNRYGPFVLLGLVFLGGQLFSSFLGVPIYFLIHVFAGV